MSERLLQLRPGVHVHEGSSGSLVLTCIEPRRALRVPGSVRGLLQVLRRGATFHQCIAAFAPADAGAANVERTIQVFLMRLQDAGVLIDDNHGSGARPAGAARGWTVSVPVPEQWQHRAAPLLAPLTRWAPFVIGVGVPAAAGMVTACIATTGNPMARAFADWSWPITVAVILPWMLIHEAAHVLAGLAVRTRVVSVTLSISIVPARLRAFVTIDPSTLPLGLHERLLLPGAGPLADLSLCGAAAGAGLLLRPDGQHAIATALTIGLWLSALTLLPVRSTDVSTMVTIAQRAAADDRTAVRWYWLVRGASTAGVAAVIALTMHGLWRMLP